MSIIPMVFGNWWDDDYFCDHPLRLLDQQMHPGLRCARQAPATLSFVIKPRTNQEAKGQKDTTASMPDKDKFQVAIDVQQFRPKEISVRTQDNCVIVEAKHEEKPDEHGFVSRHFVRRYVLPEGCEPADVKTNLSSDGVLTIVAPKKAAIPPSNERIVPIEHVGPVRKQKDEVKGDETKEEKQEEKK